MKDITKYVKDSLFDLNKKVNGATTFEEKQLYRSYLFSLLSSIPNMGIDIDLPDSLIFKAALYDSIVDENYNKAMLHSFRANRGFYKEFARLSDSILDYYTDEPYKYIEKLSFDDAIELVAGFFSVYDKDIYNFFNESVDRNLFNVFLSSSDDAKEYNGFSYPIPGKRSIVVSLDNGDLETAGNITHETIHSYLNYIDGETTYFHDIQRAANGVGETYSRFSEIAFMKYLSDIGFNQADISSYMKNFNSSLSEFLFVFADVMSLKENAILNDHLDIYYNSREYSLAGVLAYHYYDKYLDEPFEVKGDLLRLHQDSRTRDLSYLLDNCGLKKKNIVKPKLLVKHMNDFDDAA